MQKENSKISKSKHKNKVRIQTIIKRIICLILPVALAFLGYFLAPVLWILFNNDVRVPETFRFTIALVFFLIPTIIIFLESRKLNPIIDITIKDNE